MSRPLRNRSTGWRATHAAKPLPDELGRVNRLSTVGRLTGATAHQLGSPLNVALGRAQLIQSGLLSPEEIQHNAAIVVSELKRVAEAVRPLAEFAAGGSVARSVVPLGDLARRAAVLVGP